MSETPLRFPASPGDITLYHGRLLTEQQVTAVIEFDGHLEYSRLEAALSTLFEAVPFLSCTLQIHGRHFEWVQSPGYRPPIHTIRIKDNPQAKIIKFAGEMSDSLRRPPLKLLLLNCEDGDQLCIKMDHIQTDASGLRLIIYLLAEVYSQGKIILPINHDRGYAQVIRRFPPLALLEIARRENYPTFRPVRQQDRHPPQGVFIEHTRFSPQEFIHLRAEAKRHGATINNFMLAALFQTIFKNSPPDNGKKTSLMVPIDMRRYLPENARPTLANLTSSAFLSLEHVKGEPFLATLERVKTAMNRQKRHAPGLPAMLGMVFGSWFGGKVVQQSYQRMLRQGLEVMNLTNPGITDVTRLNFADIPARQIYGIGPVQYLPGLITVLSTCQDTLHMITHSDHPQRLQPFMNQFIHQIESAVVSQ